MTNTTQVNNPLKPIISQEEVDKRRKAWDGTKGNVGLSGYVPNNNVEQWVERFINGYQELPETIQGLLRIADGKSPLKEDEAINNER